MAASRLVVGNIFLNLLRDLIDLCFLAQPLKGFVPGEIWQSYPVGNLPLDTQHGGYLAFSQNENL